MRGPRLAGYLTTCRWFDSNLAISTASSSDGRAIVAKAYPAAQLVFAMIFLQNKEAGRLVVDYLLLRERSQVQVLPVPSGTVAQLVER